MVYMLLFPEKSSVQTSFISRHVREYTNKTEQILLCMLWILLLFAWGERRVGGGGGCALLPPLTVARGRKKKKEHDQPLFHSHGSYYWSLQLGDICCAAPLTTERVPPCDRARLPWWWCPLLTPTPPELCALPSPVVCMRSHGACGPAVVQPAGRTASLPASCSIPAAERAAAAAGATEPRRHISFCPHGSR